MAFGRHPGPSGRNIQVARQRSKAQSLDTAARGGDITKAMWESGRAALPYAGGVPQEGTLGYGSVYGMTSPEWTEQVSKIKSAAALASNQAMGQLSQGGGGFVDQTAMAAIASRIGAAKVSGLAGLESLNKRIISDNRKAMEEIKREKRRQGMNLGIGIIGLLLPQLGRAAGAVNTVDSFRGFRDIGGNGPEGYKHDPNYQWDTGDSRDDWGYYNESYNIGLGG